MTPSSEEIADTLDPSRFAWVPDPPEDHRPALEALGVETELDVEDVIEELQIISHDHDEVPYDRYHDLYEVLTGFIEDEFEMVEELSTEEIKLPTQSGGYERVDQLAFPYDDTVVSNLNSPSFVWVPEPLENYQTVLTVLGVQPTLEIGTVITELRRMSQTCDGVSISRFKEIYELLSTFSDEELGSIAEIEADGIRLPTTTDDCTPIEQLVIPRNELVIEKLESPGFVWIPEPIDTYQPVLQALGIDEGPSIGCILDEFDSISDRCEGVSRSRYADLYEALATFPSEQLQKISNHQTDHIRIPTSSGGCTSLEAEVYLPDNEIAITKFNDDRIAWVPSSERDIAEVLRVLGAKSAENIIEPIRDSRDGPNPFQDNTEALLKSVWNDLASMANIDTDTPPEIIWKENIVVAYEAGEKRDREHRLCLYDGTKHILYCTFQLLK